VGLGSSGGVTQGCRQLCHVDGWVTLLREWKDIVMLGYCVQQSGRFIL
jgi:hypothetical protein